MKLKRQMILVLFWQNEPKLGFDANSIQIYQEIDIRHFLANDITRQSGANCHGSCPAGFFRDADGAAPERFQ